MDLDDEITLNWRLVGLLKLDSRFRLFTAWLMLVDAGLG